MLRVDLISVWPSSSVITFSGSIVNRSAATESSLCSHSTPTSTCRNVSAWSQVCCCCEGIKDASLYPKVELTNYFCSRQSLNWISHEERTLTERAQMQSPEWFAIVDWLGASPDTLVTDLSSELPRGTFLSARKMLVHEAWRDPDFYCTIKNDCFQPKWTPLLPSGSTTTHCTCKCWPLSVVWLLCLYNKKGGCWKNLTEHNMLQYLHSRSRNYFDAYMLPEIVNPMYKPSYIYCSTASSKTVFICARVQHVYLTLTWWSIRSLWSTCLQLHRGGRKFDIAAQIKNICSLTPAAMVEPYSFILSFDLSTLILRDAILLVSALSSSSICFSSFKNGGMFTLTPSGVKSSWSSKPQSAMTKSLLSNKTLFCASSLSDI